MRKFFRHSWRHLKPALGLENVETKKTLAFCLINFLLGVGYSSGFFSSNALLIHHSGTQPLFLIYFGSSIFSLLLVGVFYLFTDQFPRKRLIQFSFALLGFLIFLCWTQLAKSQPSSVFYYLMRIFLYGVFTLTNLQFWLLASDSYTNFEARRRFPALIASEILGDFIGGSIASLLALKIGSVNLVLIWVGILLFSPLLLSFIPEHEPPKTLLSVPEVTSETVNPPPPEPSYRDYRSSLLWAILVFWVAFSLFDYGVDYIFNTVALESIRETDLLTSFFGKVTLISSAVVLFYQLFLAGPLILRLGVDRQIYLLPILYLLGLGGFCYFKNLWSATFAQGLIFFFADFAAIVIFQPILNLYPRSMRGRIKSLSEGLGRPLGILLLLLIGIGSSYFYSRYLPAYILLGLAVAFLSYPLFFKRCYIDHLKKLLRQTDYPLVSNAIQALGEPNKKSAIPELRSLLQSAEGIDLKRTIVITLGKIQSRESFQDIVQLFSVKNEAMQLAVLESLGHYKNYESMLALFRLMHSKQNVSFQVKMSATLLLTRLIGNKMIPFLLQGLDDPDIRVRANAIESIGLLRDRKTVSLLLPFLESDNNRVVANTAIALFRFRATRAKTLKAIQGLLNSSAPSARASALYAIGEMQDKRFEKDALRLLHVSDKRIVEHAAVALAKMKRPIFLAYILHLLTDPDPKIGIDVARHIGRIPKFSRMILFEKIVELRQKHRHLILERLEQTPLDFTLEKAMLLEQDRVSTQAKSSFHLFRWKVSPQGR